MLGTPRGLDDINRLWHYPHGFSPAGMDLCCGPAGEALPAVDAQALGALLENDLEPVARRLCPAIGRLQAALRDRGARAVGMSGSGATVFGVFGSQEEAREAAGDFAPPVWSRVARTQESR